MEDVEGRGTQSATRGTAEGSRQSVTTNRSREAVEPFFGDSSDGCPQLIARQPRVLGTKVLNSETAVARFFFLLCSADDQGCGMGRRLGLTLLMSEYDDADGRGKGLQTSAGPGWLVRAVSRAMLRPRVRGGRCMGRGMGRGTGREGSSRRPASGRLRIPRLAPGVWHLAPRTSGGDLPLP